LVVKFSTVKFFRRAFLVLSALILGGGQIFAASTREDHAYASAVAAFQDGLWSRAESEFAAFIQRYPKSERVAEALLSEAQAQIKQEKFSAAANLLSAARSKPGELADRYAYWLGEAQFAQGNFTNAAATFTALVKNFPESPLRLTATVETAAAFERLGNWPPIIALMEATNGAFARMAELDGANELVSRGRLLLAEAQFQQQNFPAALAVLGLVNPQSLTAELDWQRANLLCRVQAGAGDLEAALVTTTNLLELSRGQKDVSRLADSVAWHGTVLEKLGRWADAGVAWSENLTNAVPLERQREAILKIAGAAMEQKNFSDAAAMLEKFLAQFPAAPAADLAALTLGELQLKAFIADSSAINQLVQAQTGFSRLLAASKKGPLAGKAYLDRGWCFWLAEKKAESLADFRAASARLPFSEDLALAKFKTGDVYFALKNFPAARTNYQAVLQEFAELPAVVKSLGDRALYQILRADLELQDMPGAEVAMRQLLEKFPTSELADNSLLLMGEGFSNSGATDEALKLFREFEKQFPASPLTPQVQLARARTFEREQNWPAAITNYQGWLKNYPTNALRPQVEYSLGQASFQAGDDATASSAFTNFVARYPTNELAPLAQWWVADSCFRSGTNFSEAEKNYELIFQTPAWRGSVLYYPAQLMAGRAAAGRLGFPDAVNYFTKLLADTNCPPALATQAAFAYGGVLMRMDAPDAGRPLANFELATNVFAQISLANPTNEFGALATSQLGDCCLQLGALDAATNAYVQVMASPYAGVVLRSRAQVGLGRGLEKKAETAAPEVRKALLEQALKNYLDVFETSYGKGLNDGEPASAFWIKKAGLQALPLLSADNVPTNFYARMESLLPPLKAALEKKQAALKN
jgi:TolA-binding protein